VTNKPHSETPRPDLEQLIGEVLEPSETDDDNTDMTDDNTTTTDEQTDGQTDEQQNPAERVRVSETRDKVTLKTSVKRGTGTRDQDKITVKVKGHDPETAVANLSVALSELQHHGVTDEVRGFQAGEGEE